MELQSYDSWKLSNPSERKVLGMCECGCCEEIYLNEEVFDTNEGRIKEDHFKDFAMQILEVKRVMLVE